MRIKEIADHVGVSPSTVSRYINGKIQNRDGRHDKLGEMILKCGYLPPKKRNKPRILLSRFFNEPDVFSHTISMEQALQEELEKQGAQVISVISKNGNELNDQIKEFNCNGVLVTYNFENPAVPAVVVNVDYDITSLPCVNCDNSAGMIKALRYLKSKGHENVAYFDSLEKNDMTYDPRHYFAESAYFFAGLNYDPKFIWRKTFGYKEHPAVIAEAVKYFLLLKPRPTAIMIFCDLYGISFYDSLKNEGLSVPEDMSIIGFDGSPVCDMLRPSLATIAKPIREMAYEAVSMLMRNIETKGGNMVKILVEPELVEGDSVLDRNKKKRN